MIELYKIYPCTIYIVHVCPLLRVRGRDEVLEKSLCNWFENSKRLIHYSQSYPSALAGLDFAFPLL